MSIEEKLIKLVRQSELLYDRGCLDYRNNELKDKKWREIAAALRVDVLKAKQRWKSLRDRYTRERARNKVLRQSGKTPVISWQHYKDLEFLKDHTKERAKLTPDSECVIENENTQMYDPNLDEQPCMAYEVESVDLPGVEFKPRTKMFSQNSQLPPLTPANGNISAKDVLTQRIEDQLNKLVNQIDRSGERQYMQSPVHAFFNAMAIQIEHANLPLSTWFALQQEIMQLINSTISALNPE